MPRESVGMSTIVVRCYKATVLLLKVPNVLCAAATGSCHSTNVLYAVLREAAL